MLGKPASSITAILDKFSGQLFTLEYKYDGERAQVHRTKDGDGEGVQRATARTTLKQVPGRGEQAEEVRGERAWSTTSSTAECVAWDKAEKRLLPFQTLTTRKRKDVKEEDITVQVALFAFDLLYLNGRAYMQETACVRVGRRYTAHFTQVEGEFSFATHKERVGRGGDLRLPQRRGAQSACEGLMVKPLDDGSQYTPGKRSVAQVQEGLPGRSGRHARPRAHRGLLRQGQAHWRVRRLPAGVLRRGGGGVPVHLQDSAPDSARRTSHAHAAFFQTTCGRTAAAACCPPARATTSSGRP